jgi:hypothetical protein
MHPDITKLVAPMHDPCRFMKRCEDSWKNEDQRVARDLTLWSPATGWVPCGFCGAEAGASGIELVLVVGEPSRPDRTNQMHDEQDTIRAASEHSKRNMLTNRTITHRGMQFILNFFYPNEAIESLFDRIFRMESVFCPIPAPLAEGTNIPFAVERTCGENYVLPLLQAFPNALIVAAGRTQDEKKRKARERIKWLGDTHDQSLAERVIFVHHPSYWSRRRREAEEICWQELRRKTLRSDLPLLQRARERARR